MKPRCPHPETTEIARTWEEVIDRVGHVTKYLVIHLRCSKCGVLFGRAVWNVEQDAGV
jgi:hypothetical protein